jgi:hypothetical protein
MRLWRYAERFTGERVHGCQDHQPLSHVTLRFTHENADNGIVIFQNLIEQLQNLIEQRTVLCRDHCPEAIPLHLEGPGQRAVAPGRESIGSGNRSTRVSVTRRRPRRLDRAIPSLSR